MLVLGIIGGVILLYGKSFGLRLAFFATLMFAFFRILEFSWALEHIQGVFENSKNNPIADYLHMEYLKLKVLPSTKIPLYNKIYFYYLWGIMPVIQFFLLLILPTLIILDRNIPSNKQLHEDRANSARPVS